METINLFLNQHCSGSSSSRTTPWRVWGWSRRSGWNWSSQTSSGDTWRTLFTKVVLTPHTPHLTPHLTPLTPHLTLRFICQIYRKSWSSRRTLAGSYRYTRTGPALSGTRESSSSRGKHCPSLRRWRNSLTTSPVETSTPTPWSTSVLWWRRWWCQYSRTRQTCQSSHNAFLMVIIFIWKHLLLKVILVKMSVVFNAHFSLLTWLLCKC